MEKKLGLVFGSLAAAAVVVLGLRQGVPLVETLLRAAIGMGLGFALGWLVFGRLGAAVMKEAAGSDAEKEDK